MKLSACVFDMDGTVLDSEPNYYASEKAFLGEYGIEYTEDLKRAMTGLGSKTFLGFLERRWPDNPLNALPLRERMALKDKAYLAYSEGRTRAFPAMIHLLDLLGTQGIPCAIASGSTLPVIETTLRWAGIRERFSAVVAAEEVPRGKPEPDIFLEAARRLGVPPESCLAFEDSLPGVRSARKAGMACVAVPSWTGDGAAVDPGFREAELVFSGGAATLDPERVLQGFFRER